jgi:hypothetical protein
MTRVARVSPENWLHKWPNTSWMQKQVNHNKDYAGEMRPTICREVQAKAASDRTQQRVSREQQTGGGSGSDLWVAAVWRQGCGREGEAIWGRLA